MSTTPLLQVQPMRVRSSLIASVAYHAALCFLDLALTNGYRYRYFAVPHHVYKGLLKAPSKGRFFNANIKNVFPYHKF